jgi:hypothetical protein
MRLDGPDAPSPDRSRFEFEMSAPDNYLVGLLPQPFFPNVLIPEIRRADRRSPRSFISISSSPVLISARIRNLAFSTLQSRPEQILGRRTIPAKPTKKRGMQHGRHNLPRVDDLFGGRAGVPQRHACVAGLLAIDHGVRRAVAQRMLLISVLVIVLNVRSGL